MIKRLILLVLSGSFIAGCVSNNQADRQMAEHKMASNAPVSGFNLRENIEQSELIMIGTAVSVQPVSGALQAISTEADTSYDQLFEVILNVDKIIDGTIIEKQIAVLFIKSDMPSRPWLIFHPGATYLAFLKRYNNAYIPAVITGNTLAIPRTISYNAVTGEKLASVANVLEQIISNINASENPEMLIQVTTARTELHHNFDFSRLSSVNDPLKQMAWITIGLTERNPEALKALEDVLTLQNKSASFQTLKSLAIQQIPFFNSPEYCEPVSRFLQLPDTEVNLAAVTALRKMHSKQATATLIHALKHQDQSVRFQSVMGLSELYEDVCEKLSFELYEQKEKYYLYIWERWWLSQK